MRVDSIGSEIESVLDQHRLTADDIGELFAEYRQAMDAEVTAVIAERSHLDSVFPVVDFADVAADNVDAAILDTIRRRGCVVIRNTFDRSLAETWDRGLAEYFATNRFWERYAERNPDEAATGSRISGVYWSRPQIQGRQHDNMAKVREFLNSFWTHESEGRTWFDPIHDIGFPDRVRRREPGAVAKGLKPHTDSASAAGWRAPENLLVNRHMMAGRIADYDPYDAAYRTDPVGTEPLPSDVFRTFQGWTALSEMWPTDGVLHTIPIPAAASYLVLKGIASECGALDEPVPRRMTADEVLLPAVSPIPTVFPGDTVWWHGDLIHSVGAAANETRWGNVMYIAATPRCVRNDEYAFTMLDRFVRGASPKDFPDEDFEQDFAGRATIGDLNRRGMEMFRLN